MSLDIYNVPRLLQPELLTVEELRTILISRYVRVANIENLNKDQLINLFHRVVTPLEQRCRNDNRNKKCEQNTPMNETKTNHKCNNEIENGIKKLKFTPNKIQLKRPQIIKTTDNDEVSSKKKPRTTICWP